MGSSTTHQAGTPDRAIPATLAVAPAVYLLCAVARVNQYLQFPARKGLPELNGCCCQLSHAFAQPFSNSGSCFSVSFFLISLITVLEFRSFTSMDVQAGGRGRMECSNEAGGQPIVDEPWVLVHKRDAQTACSPRLAREEELDPDQYIQSSLEGYFDRRLMCACRMYSDATLNAVGASASSRLPILRADSEPCCVAYEREGVCHCDQIQDPMETLDTFDPDSGRSRQCRFRHDNNVERYDDQTSVVSEPTSEPPVLEEYFAAARELYIKRERRDEMHAVILDTASRGVEHPDVSPLGSDNDNATNHSRILAHQELLWEVAGAEQKLLIQQIACIEQGVNPEKYRYRRMSSNGSDSGSD